jgi:hypothetical protein
MSNCLDIHRTVEHNIDHIDAWENYTELEVPVRGPDPVTTLVIISGIAITEMDICSEITGADLGDWYPFKLFIQTKYHFDVGSDYRDGSVYAWLSSFQDDDFDRPCAVEIDNVRVGLNSNNRVEIFVEGSLHGDIALERVGYQAFVLSSKPRPTPSTQSSRRRAMRNLLEVGIHVRDFPSHR